MDTSTPTFFFPGIFPQDECSFLKRDASLIGALYFRSLPQNVEPTLLSTGITASNPLPSPLFLHVTCFLSGVFKTHFSLPNA